MIEKQIEQCKKLIEQGGVCSGLLCQNCPPYINTDLGCWEAETSHWEPSEIVVTKAKEFLIEHQEIL